MDALLAPKAGATATPRSRLSRLLALDPLDDRYPALHGLRVLAILTVVQFHVTWIFAGEQGIALDGGFVRASLSIFFGMDLFFILSGFLIGSILLRALEEEGRQRLARFYLRRAFRTFPSYWMVLTVLALSFTLTAAQRSHLPFEYAYLTNFEPLARPEIVMFWGWSLALEEQFYLAVPLLLFALHRLRSDGARLALLGGLWCVSPVARLAIYLAHRPWSDLALYDALYFRTLTRFDTLVAGVLLALIHRRYGVRLTAWLIDPFHRALLALPSLACLWVLAFPSLMGERNVQLVHVFAWGSLTSLMYLPALILLLHGEGAIRRALSAPLFRRVATLGYGVYLVHIPLCDHAIVPLAKRLERMGVGLAIVWPLSFVALMAASLAVAYALHLLVEKPSLWLRARLAA